METWDGDFLLEIPSTPRRPDSGEYIRVMYERIIDGDEQLLS